MCCFILGLILSFSRSLHDCASMLAFFSGVLGFNHSSGIKRKYKYLDFSAFRSFSG